MGLQLHQSSNTNCHDLSGQLIEKLHSQSWFLSDLKQSSPQQSYFQAICQKQLATTVHSQGLHNFTLPATVHEGPNFSTTSPILVILVF